MYYTFVNKVFLIGAEGVYYKKVAANPTCLPEHDTRSGDIHGHSYPCLAHQNEELGYWT